MHCDVERDSRRGLNNTRDLVCDSDVGCVGELRKLPLPKALWPSKSLSLLMIEESHRLWALGLRITIRGEAHNSVLASPRPFSSTRMGYGISAEPGCHWVSLVTYSIASFIVVFGRGRIWQAPPRSWHHLRGEGIMTWKSIVLGLGIIKRTDGSFLSSPMFSSSRLPRVRCTPTHTHTTGIDTLSSESQ